MDSEEWASFIRYDNLKPLNNEEFNVFYSAITAAVNGEDERAIYPNEEDPE